MLNCGAERRQDGVRRDPTDGGHGAVQRGAAGRYEETVGGRRRPGVLRPLQRVPAQRLRQIVSDLTISTRATEINPPTMASRSVHQNAYRGFPAKTRLMLYCIFF